EEQYRLETQYPLAEWGSDITVPCHLSPEISAVDMEIKWLKQTDCVCLYKNRQMFEGRGYKGRLSLFTEELDGGNVSLQLRDFRRSDVGVYLCQVTSTDRTEEITIRVVCEYFIISFCTVLSQHTPFLTICENISIHN
uniref:Ig-like domain-containing protein n=1 Tax=Sinocyclocheilus grahami TaxID=75366 RepID=A0A672NJV0_SINGR